MITLMPLMLAFASSDVTALIERDRFPGPRVCHAQVDALVRLQQTLKSSRPTRERDEGIRVVTKQIVAWEMLLEAWEGLGLDESPKANAEVRLRALKRLREILGEKDWKAGRMP